VIQPVRRHAGTPVDSYDDVTGTQLPVCLSLRRVQLVRGEGRGVST
jgi:hypothetical protein